MGAVIRLALVALLAAAGCYRVTAVDCTVTCGDAGACPSGTLCAEGYCRPPGATGRCLADAVLRVAVGGDGAGQVTSTPAGIACPPTCEATFGTPGSVGLTATWDSTTTVFGGFTGCDSSGVDSCVATLELGGSKDVAVDFTTGVPLSVQVHGAGHVGSAPAGVDCGGGTCVRAFLPGTTLTLSAGPAEGATFFRWAGACAGTDPCELTLDRPLAAGAWFDSGDATLARSFGEGGHDEAHAVAADSHGTTILAGSFGGLVDLGGGALQSAGGLDGFVAAFAPDGAHRWSQRFGAIGDDLVYSAAVDRDGDVVVAGIFSGAVDFGGGTRHSAGSTDLFVVKLSAAGEHVWSAGFGGPGEDPWAVVAVAPDGDVVLAGTAQGTLDLGGGPLLDRGALDWFVGRFAPDGAHRWSRRFGGASDDYLGGVAVTPAGAVAIVGSFAGTVDFGGGQLESAGGDDVAVALLAGDGEHVWSRRYGSTGDDRAESVAAAADGVLAVGGYFTGPIDFGDETYDPAGSQHAFVLTLRPDGSTRWSLPIGGQGAAHAAAAAVDDRGQVVVAGTFTGTASLGAGPVTSAGAGDGFVAAFGTAATGDQGLHRWSRRLGGTGDDVVTALAVDRRGDVLAGGSFSGAVDVDGAQLTSHGGRDALALRLRSPLADQWALGFGNASEAYSAAVDHDGNVYVTGLFTGTVDFGGGALQSVDGGDDVFLAKLSPLGRHLWSRAYGGSGSDYGLNVAVDQGGNVVLTGAFTDTADFGDGPVTSAGASDVFVVSLSPDGDRRWSRTVGGPGDDLGYWLTTDAQRNVVVAGFFADTVDFGAGPRPSNGLDDLFVLKLSPDGAHLWSRTYGGPGVDDAYTVAVTPSGQVAIAGYFSGSLDLGGDPLESVEGSDDVFVALLSADGEHVWSRSFGGPMSDVAWGVAATPDGGVVVTGHFAGAVDFGGGALQSTEESDDVFVVKLSASGDHEWSRAFGAARDETGTDVAVRPDGDVVVTGYFAETVDFGSSRVSSLAGSDDVFVARLSAAGVPLWMRALGGPGSDVAYRVAVDGDAVVLAGSFEQSADFWVAELATTGSTAIFVARYHADEYP